MSNRRVIAISAAGGGIGRAVARRFAVEGAALALNDIDERALQETAADARRAGAEVVLFPADIAQPTAPGEFVQAAIGAFGRIDVLHNNAGFGRQGRMEEFTDEDWYSQERVVLDSVAFGTRAVVPHMMKQGGGCIVNTASIGGIIGRPGGGPYSAFKAAVIRLTEVTAMENARFGIRCVAVAPGAVRTAVLERWLESIGSSVDRYDNNILGRLTEPAEVAEVVYWLASDKASAVTGVTVPVNQPAR